MLLSKNNSKQRKSENAKIKILVVDDQPSNLRFLSEVLCQEGYSVKRAISGELALNYAIAFPPDIILLDIMMPEMNGYEVCQKLKENPQTKDIPVIFLSVLDQVSEKVKAFHVGGTDYITKPFQVEEVLVRVENQLTIKNLQVQLQNQNQQLQKTKSLLASILNSSLDGITALASVRNSQGKIVDFKYVLLNKTAEKLKKSTSEELVGESLLKKFPGHQESGLFDAYVKVVETDESLNTKIYYSYENIQLWVQITAVKLGDGLAITFRDITSEKQAQEALRESEERFRIIFEQAAVGMNQLSVTGQFLRVNKQLCQISGYPEPELLQLTWQDWTLPEDINRCSNYINQLLTGKIDNYSVEKRLIRKDSQLKWVNISTSLVRDWQGNPQYFIEIIEDISRRKQIEEELQNSQRWLQAITDANPNLLYIYKLPELQNIYINAEVMKILGYTPEELQELQSTDWLNLIHQDDRQILQKKFTKLETIKDGEAIEFEYRIHHKNGEWLWLFTREIIFSRTPDGKPEQILGAATDISDRKKTEAALKQSEARFQKLADNLPGVIYEVIQKPDGTFNLTYISSSCREIYELEPEQIQEDLELAFSKIHPDDRKSYDENIQICSQSLEPCRWEGRITTQSGIKWIQAASKPEYHSNGEVIWHGLMFDITDRKLSEAKLKESQKRLSFFVQQTPVAIIEWNTNFEIVAWNPAAEKIFGYRAAEVINVNVLQLIVPPEELENITHILQNVIQEGNEKININQNLTKDGKRIICQWYNTALVDNHGQAIGGAAMAIDITESQKTEAALRESAERSKAIAKAIERIRQTLNLETIFKATTSELRQVLNCDRVAIYRFNPDWSGEFVAESVASGWVSLIAPSQENSNLATDCLNLERCLVKNWITPENPIKDTYLQETEGGAYTRGVSYLAVADIHKTNFARCYINLLEQFQAKAYLTVPIFCGNKIWGLLANYQNSSPRQWQEAEIDVVVQIGTQLAVALQQAELLEQTQRQSLELMKAKESADAANKAKSQFLAKMSHELRTPLNAILGFSQLMARSTTLSSEQQEYIEIINRSGEHLLDLINDILSMAKIEAGQVTLNEDPFNLHELLNSLEELLQLKANSKGLQLIFEIAPQVPKNIQTDESKLRQVLLNLLGNAIKFTQTGIVKLQVILEETEISNHQAKIVFIVEDTGPGIAPNEILALFQPFVQTQTGRQTGQGTGLGLPISQQFIKLMGGDITVRSQLGQGTTFTFYIFARLVSHPQQKVLSPTKKIIGLEPNQPTYRILIVEDLKENRQLVVKLLTPFKFEIREAENGQEAITIWENWRPDLIWMDMQMPIMDGYETTKYIKSHSPGKDTVIIALTASAFQEQQSEILKAGCDDFLPKPFREEILLEKMAKHLGLRYVYQENTSFTTAINSAETKIINPNDLQMMPKEWLKKLHEAALAINDREVTELIEQIPASNLELKQTLVDLVDNFRMDIIIDITRERPDE